MRLADFPRFAGSKKRVMLRSAIEPHKSPASLGALLSPQHTRVAVEDHPTKALTKNQRRYQRQKATGLCLYASCRSRPESGHLKCRKHLRLMSRRHRERYRERINRALCIYCGERPGFWGTRCIVCRQRFGQDPLPPEARGRLRLYREAEKQFELEQLQAHVRFAIRKLLLTRDIPPDQATALRLYAGLDNNCWRTYSEVGRLMHVSRERVRQLLYPSKIILARMLGQAVPWKPVTVPAPNTP